MQSSQVVLVVKNVPTNAGGVRNMGLIHGWGRSSGGGHGNPFQCSYLENPMDKRSLGSPWGHRSQTQLKLLKPTPTDHAVQYKNSNGWKT